MNIIKAEKNCTQFVVGIGHQRPMVQWQQVAFAKLIIQDAKKREREKESIALSNI